MLSGNTSGVAPVDEPNTTVATSLVRRSWIHSLRWNSVALAILMILFSGFAIGVILTKRPWCDEAWFASIVYNVVHHGVMGLTVLDPHGFVFAPNVRGIERYTYWVLPNYIFLQAAWVSIFGLNVFTFRLLSTVWGCVLLYSWYFVVFRLTRDRRVAVVSAVILGLDQNFIVSGASGRMDMMCAALNLAASAIYIRLRRRFHLAVFAASCVLASALLTHPNALFGAILLAILVFSLDRNQIRWRTLLIAGVPFLAAVGLWLTYIVQAPDIFIAQMGAQGRIPHRLAFDWNLIRHFEHELRMRYAKAYSLSAHDPRVFATGSVFILYFGGTLALAAIKILRNRPGSKQILLFAALSFTLLSCLQDNAYYLVYVLPAFAAAVAISIVFAWERQRWVGHGVGVIALAAVLLNLLVPGYRIFHDDFRGRYTPAVNYLKNNAATTDLIIGSGELAFALGFDGRVVDDCRLGFSSGRNPDFIVLEGQYYHFWFPWLAAQEPETFQYIKRLLDERYVIAYDQIRDPFVSLGSSDLPYRIYARKRSE